MGSLFGGFNCTIVFGSNLPAIAEEPTARCLCEDFVKSQMLLEELEEVVGFHSVIRVFFGSANVQFSFSIPVGPDS
jgi:hypothetical protein